MGGDEKEEDTGRGRRLDRAWKLLGRVSMPTSIPLCEPELHFLFRPDQIYPEGHLWPGFAPIHDLLANRTYVVEHFSDSLRRHARLRMLTLCRNLGYEHEKWMRKGELAAHPLAGTLPPMLVVAGAARPDAFLSQGVLRADAEIPGLYRGLGEYAELLYLWFYGLDPEDRRWDVLRWAVPQHPRTPVDRMRYFEDPMVTVEEKNEVWSAIMSEQYAIDKGAIESHYHMVLEKGREQGLELGIDRGLEQGLEQGKNALLFVAQGVLPASELARFRERPASAELLVEMRQAIADRLELKDR